MILVTGASGAMGSVLVKKLCGKGFSMRACILPNDPFKGRIADACEDIRFGDIAQKSSIAGICDGIAAVYHLAAIILSPDEREFERINVQGTKNIVEEAKKAGVKHFIYVSSASVIYPLPTPYSLSKQRAEKIVKASGLTYTIIRPTLVYGERGGLEFDKYLNYLKKYPIVPFIGSGKSMKRPVHVDDIIDGLAAANDSAKASGRIYNFSGGEALSMLDFTRLCLRLLGRPRKPMVHLPIWLCHVIAWIMGIFMKDPPLKWQTIAGLTQDADLDPTLAMNEIGYNPRKVSEGLPKCFPRKSP